VEHQHHASPVTYVTIFALLVVLTGVTVWVAGVDLGPLNATIALAIATTKATLVVLFFMHVKDSSRLTQLFLVAGLIWLGILLFITMSDFASRSWLAG
jgi:cytochrome c oxidase subunit 4